MRSANEISAMVLKAARGAGLSLGCAEELASAAPELAAIGKLVCAYEVLQIAPCCPKLHEGAVLGGHPVQAVIAWRDLKAAGVARNLECDVALELLEALCGAQSVCGPFEVDQALWDQFAAYASRMFVPESDASRLAGAGAGLSDND